MCEHTGLGRKRIEDVTPGAVVWWGGSFRGADPKLCAWASLIGGDKVNKDMNAIDLLY